MQVKPLKRNYSKRTSHTEETRPTCHSGSQKLFEDVNVLESVKYGEHTERIDPGIARVDSDEQDGNKCDQAVENEVRHLAVEGRAKKAGTRELLGDVLNQVPELREKHPGEEPSASECSVAYRLYGASVTSSSR